MGSVRPNLPYVASHRGGSGPVVGTYVVYTIDSRWLRTQQRERVAALVSRWFLVVGVRCVPANLECFVLPTSGRVVDVRADLVSICLVST